jgi:hypothetical protein
MTDPIQPGTTPAPQPGSPAAATPPMAPSEPPLPAVEPVEPGTSAPAEAVARDGAASGTQPGRPSRVRWAIALVGVALVIGIAAAIVALAAGRPAPSIAVGYMPEDAVQYMEYRFDLPGDQRQKVASFLSAFPGFDDQAPIDTKLDESFDRILAAATENELTWTADIDPWFGGIVAMGSGAPDPEDASGGIRVFGASDSVVVLTVKDRDLAAAWFESVGDTQVARGEYNGTILYTSTGGLGPRFAAAINDEVMLVGTEDAVKAALDSGGDGGLADDPEFKAAFDIVTEDYVFFSFLDYKSLLDASMALADEGASNTDAVAIATQLTSLVPAWIGTYGRFENDAIAFETAQPSGDLNAGDGNAGSTLLGMAPPDTIAYAETHDVGAVIRELINSLREVAAVDEHLDEVEATIGMTADDIFGWWGDAAVVVSDQGGTVGGGLLVVPTDAAAAERLFVVLRSAVAFAGGGAGVELRDVQHGDTTITVIDFSDASGYNEGDLPPGYEPEIAWAVTPEVVVVGYGQAFVESVLDAGPGPSLADDARVSGLLDRVGDENLSFTFLDIRAARELVEPLMREGMSPEEWSQYETEIKPFLLPFDAMAASLQKDGDLDRGSSVITVTKP